MDFLADWNRWVDATPPGEEEDPDICMCTSLMKPDTAHTPSCLWANTPPDQRKFMAIATPEFADLWHVPIAISSTGSCNSFEACKFCGTEDRLSYINYTSPEKPNYSNDEPKMFAKDNNRICKWDTTSSVPRKMRRAAEMALAPALKIIKKDRKGRH